LSIRGELERNLLYEAVMELGYDDQAPAAADRLLAPELQVSEPDVYQEQTQWLNGQVTGLVESWRKASEKVAAVPAPPIPLVSSTSLADPTVAESVARGERIYRGPIANCATCHGVSGRGDGITKDYDEWTKEWTIRSGLSPGDSIGVKPFLRVGALPPRNVLPRNLRLGVFRGGSTPEDIYRRITHGIEGTPMPAVNLVEQPSGTGLTTAEVWDLVNFVLSLSLESGQRALLGEKS
jgi:mono/diheme cytochrome c family protein